MYKKMELEQQDAVRTKSDRSALIQPDVNRHGGRVDEVHFNTRGTAKGVQIQDHLVEAIQPIEKDVNRHKSTGTNSCNHLITQSPVLDLLHAHGDSPKERCSSRLVPFAIRICSLRSRHPSANPLFP